MAIRVLIVDDHPMIRAGLRDVFEATDDIEIVGEATNADEAIELFIRAYPDVSLLDLQIPDADGVDLCRKMKTLVPSVACLIFSAHDDAARMADAASAGASGWLLKGATADQLTGAIRRIVSGETAFPDDLPERIVRKLQKPTESVVKLNESEDQTLGLLAQGLSNVEIADELGTTEKAVRNRVSRILQKIGVRDRTQAALYAQRRQFGRESS